MAAELSESEFAKMLSKLKGALIGKGKAFHLSKGNDETLCGKYVNLRYADMSDVLDYNPCKRCYAKAESDYAYNRKVAYGAMRDAELDRQSYGGAPYTKEEEEVSMASYAAIPDAEVIVLPAVWETNGPVLETLDSLPECYWACGSKIVAVWHDSVGNVEGACADHLSKADRMPHTMLAEASPELINVLWSYRDAQGRVWGPYSDSEFTHTDGSAERYCTGIVDTVGAGEVIRIERYASDYATTGKNWEDTYIVTHVADAGFRETDSEPMEDTMSAPLVVEADLSVFTGGVWLNIGWHTLEFPIGTEESIPDAYGRLHGSGNPRGGWSSIIRVNESHTL